MTQRHEAVDLQDLVSDLAPYLAVEQRRRRLSGCSSNFPVCSFRRSRPSRSIAVGAHCLRLPGADEKFDGFDVRDRLGWSDPALVGNIEFRETIQKDLNSVRMVVRVYINIYCRRPNIAEHLCHLRT